MPAVRRMAESPPELLCSETCSHKHDGRLIARGDESGHCSDTGIKSVPPSCGFQLRKHLIQRFPIQKSPLYDNAVYIRCLPNIGQWIGVENNHIRPLAWFNTSELPFLPQC